MNKGEKEEVVLGARLEDNCTDCHLVMHVFVLPW